MRKRRKRAPGVALGLAAYRLARGGTQTEEARRSLVSESTWRRWETGRCTPPMRALQSVAERWGVDVAELLEAPVDAPDAEVRALVERHGDAVITSVTRVTGYALCKDDRSPLDDRSE